MWEQSGRRAKRLRDTSADVAKRRSKPSGRPTKYQRQFAEYAGDLALLGCTDAEMADIFMVSETCFKHWKERHAEFAQALDRGKAHADAKVARSLYQRAVGFEQRAVKVFGDVASGNELVVPYTIQHPPDTNAALAWLRNRQPEKWRAEPQAVAVANASANASTVAGISEDILGRLRARAAGEVRSEK